MKRPNFYDAVIDIFDATTCHRIDLKYLIGNPELKTCLEIMEEPHFIKCEPEWSAETEEILNSERDDYFPCNSLRRVKTGTESSCDPELNAKEENRDLFTEYEN
ncbi:uncharacterized protein [Anabrus simplex]|uniref:uncharacterized protein n=1 Tax=Anabrus simplex TaxID=316456 RepID=UPI0035A3A8B0